MTRHVGNPTMSEDGVYARWPVSRRPFALFGKPYVWIREAKTRDIIDDPDFDFRQLPLVLVKVPRYEPSTEKDPFREAWERLDQVAQGSPVTEDELREMAEDEWP